MKMFKLLIGFFFISLFAGCASVKYADKPATLTPQPDKGLVYFYRETAFVGGMISYKIKETDVQIGALANGTYFAVQAAPGAHTYTASTESTESIIVSVEAGKTYYVRGGVNMGFMAGRPSLTEVTESEAKNKIPKLKYTDIGTPVPPKAKTKTKK